VTEVLGEVVKYVTPRVSFTLFDSGVQIDSLSASDRGTALAVAPASYRGIDNRSAGCISTCGSQIGFLLTPADTPIATFWPPNAILLAALLLNFSANLVGSYSGGVPRASFHPAKHRHTLDLRALMVCRKHRRARCGAVFVRIFKKDKPLFRKRPRGDRFLGLWCSSADSCTSFLDAAV